MPVLDFELVQGSPEWLVMKRGVVGSSNAHRLVTKKGTSPEAKLRTYAKDLFVARTLRELAEQANTKEMQWGVRYEYAARSRWEIETGQTVVPVGYAWRDGWEKWIGCSPDGLVGEDAIIECKAPSSAVHMGYVLDGQAPHEYVCQMQFILWVTERDKAHFVSFDPRLKSPLDFLTVEYGRDDAMISALQEGAERTVEILQGYLEKYT